jgi:hypothetical protein
MSNYDGGWLFKCCPNEIECDCRWADWDCSPGLCADHCDRTPFCAGTEPPTVQVPPHIPVDDGHLVAWYNWAGRILEDDSDHNEADDWQLNCACARLRVVIDDLRRLRQEVDDDES